MWDIEKVKRIKAHTLYRGQLLPYLHICASLRADDTKIDEEFDYILRMLGIKPLDFQKRAVLSFRNGDNVFLTGGYGLGRSTTIDILGIHQIFKKGKTVLYLFPDAERLEEKVAKIQGKLDKLKQYVPITVEYADTTVALRERIKKFPEIMLTTAETFFDYLRNYCQEKNARDFLFSIDLIGIEKLELYQAIEIIYLSRLINLLEYFSGAQFAIVSSTVEDYQALLNLFGGRKKVEAIQIREFLNNNDLAVWLPPFDVALLEDKNTFRFARNHFLNEIKNLLKILMDIGEKKVLVWYAYTHLPSQIKLDLSIHADITIVEDLARLPRAYQREFDAAIVVGMPRDFKNIAANINSVIKENGIVFIIPPDDLLSYMLMWSEFSLVNELPGRKLFPVSETSLLADLFARLKKYINGKKIDLAHIPYWGTVSNDHIKLRYMSSGSEKMVDRELIPFEFYTGKVHFESEKRFFTEITSTDPEGEIRLLTPGMDYAASTPVMKHCFISSEGHGRENRSFFGSAKAVECKINFDQEGYFLFSDYAQEKRSLTRFSEPLKFSKYLKGIHIQTDHFREYDHMLKNFMPLLFPGPFKLFFVVADAEQNGIFIFPHQAKLFHFVEKMFYLDADSTFRKLFQFAYKALLKCPCADGCSKCLYYVFHQEQDGLSKNNFGSFLAETFGGEEKQNFENLIAFRRGSITDLAKLTNFYNGIKQRVLPILKDNLDVFLRAPVPLLAVKDLGGGILGTYDGKSVKVIPLPELQAIQVISHEYIHNWEEEVGILARGDKFISEGAAQWLSTKVLNYFYQIDEIEADIMGTSAEHLKEYFNGFQFLQEVDGIDGYLNTLQALITNTWTQEQLEMRRKWEEYRPQGAEAPAKKPSKSNKKPKK